MKHIFLDTNIIIDLLADRKPFSEAATQLFNDAEKGKCSLYISALSYSNIYYIVKKQCSHRQMLAILRDLEALVITVDVTRPIISHALQTEFKDFEDAIQYNTAISHQKIEAIITRNPKDFKLSKLSVLTPEEAVKIIETVK